MIPKKRNASQLRVDGPLTCSLLHASQLRCAGTGHGKWVPGGPLFSETLQSAQTSLLGAWQASFTLKCAALLVAQEIDENDLERMAVIHRDSAWQAEWELLAIVVSVDLWRPLLATRAVTLVQTDFSAARGVARRLAGRAPAMNNLAAELGLRLQCMGCTRQDEWASSGALNVEADARSRLTQGSSVPVCLRHVPCVHPPVRNGSWFWTWPKARNFRICVLHLT